MVGGFRMPAGCSSLQHFCFVKCFFVEVYAVVD